MACIEAPSTDAKRFTTAIIPAQVAIPTIITTLGLPAAHFAAGAARTSHAIASGYAASFVTDVKRVAARNVCAQRNTTMQLLRTAVGLGRQIAHGVVIVTRERPCSFRCLFLIGAKFDGSVHAVPSRNSIMITSSLAA